MFLKKRLLQKLTVRYEDDLEKISMLFQSIGNCKMLSSSEFHVSESSLSKVIAAQSWQSKAANHLKIASSCNKN
jgi:hypothetical protein